MSSEFPLKMIFFFDVATMSELIGSILKTVWSGTEINIKTGGGNGNFPQNNHVKQVHQNQGENHNTHKKTKPKKRRMSRKELRRRLADCPETDCLRAD